MSIARKREEMRALSARINALSAAGRIPRVADLEAYHRLAEATKAEQCLGDALVEKALVLVREGHLFEALNLFEAPLKADPYSPNLLKALGSVRTFVSDEMILLADQDPGHADYGRTYERLLEIGYVSHHVHVGAVRHYLLRGQIDSASIRLLALLKLAPNALVLVDLVLRLCELTDDPTLQQHRIRLQGGRQ
jgi:tetratricopeptide (TPR) repeat protein